jgi:predicted transcriptional regulator
MARPASEHPTEGELEILKVLWEVGPSELGPIRAALQRRRPVATTTVATMLKLMLAKGLVQRDDGPRGYVWSAGVSHEAAANTLVGNLLDRLFEGSARRLVAHMIERGKLSAQDREALRRLLEDHDAPGDPGKGDRSS